MAVIIEQLWDIELGRAVRVEDADRYELVTGEVVSVTADDGSTHRYQIYRHRRGATPYDRDTAHFKTRYNDDRPPFRLYTIENNTQQPDLAHLAHQFHTRWGDGYYRGYFIGGQNPPIEYFWQRRWITKLGGH